MYTVRTGFYNEYIFPDRFTSVVDAMDFADELVNQHGFFFSRVVDGHGKADYYVEDRRPCTKEEREARAMKSETFKQKNYLDWWENQKKVNQDAAYETYQDNIRWSRELDEILSSAPGYLKYGYLK